MKVTGFEIITAIHDNREYENYCQTSVGVQYYPTEIVFGLKTILWLKSLESYIKAASRNPETGTEGCM